MHYNMIHNRNIGSIEEPKWVMFEEQDWYIGDNEALIKLADAYVDLGFDWGYIESADGTLLVVLYNKNLGWRIIQTRA